MGLFGGLTKMEAPSTAIIILAKFDDYKTDTV